MFGGGGGFLFCGVLNFHWPQTLLTSKAYKLLSNEGMWVWEMVFMAYNFSWQCEVCADRLYRLLLAYLSVS